MTKFQEVAQAALEIADEAQRRKMLDGACAGDEDLRARVGKFLVAQEPAESFFSECAEALVKSKRDLEFLAGLQLKGDPTLPAEESIGDPVGLKIGSYKLLQKIGEGGCGVVYMAEQEQPVRRRVALKIIKLGMDTKSVIARFEAERQALALMDHPNIARVLDAGAMETGRPYFVMELVHGIRITEYCDANKLATRQRLELFIRVCQAIQHAHQKGVVHRDIKPSNILVTMLDGTPVPKVIDFGIAKAMEEKLTDKTLFTLYGHFIGTPAYMSPEQAQVSGMDVDTRSDIYSLGVLLYELLTGRTPFDQKELMASGIDEMRRTLISREPHRPSTRLDILTLDELTMTAQQRHVEPARLRLDLQGDLDWIVLRALEKDRSRRYQTANGLALDIQRYLDNEPVLARPPSRVYRLKKLIRRNQVVFISSFAVAAALIAGSVVSTRLWLKEREALNREVASEQQKTVLQQEAAHLETLRQKAEERGKYAQATTFFLQAKLDKADDLLDEIPNYEAEFAVMYRQIGDWDVQQGRLAKATRRFETLFQINQATNFDSTLDDFRLAAVLADQGETVKYQQLRKTVTTRYAKSKNPDIVSHVLRICLLTKVDSGTIEALNYFNNLTVESIEHSSNKLSDYAAAWRAYSVALMAYRCGNYASATNWCGQALRYSHDTLCRDAGVQLIQAMAMAQLGATNAASLQLAATRDAVEKQISGLPSKSAQWQGYWFDWTIIRILTREAMNQIEVEPEADN